MKKKSYNLVDDMNFIRELCSSIHAARKAVGIPTSQPLQSLTLYKGEELYDFLLQPFKKVVEDECNIKEVNWELVFDDDYRFHDISTEYRLDFKGAGKLFGKNTQAIGKHVKAGNVVLGDTHAQVGEFEVPLDLISYNRTVDNTANQKSLGIYVDLVLDESFFVLDTKVTPELRAEHLAGVATKLINTERRAKGFRITDTVDVTIQCPEEYATVSDALWDTVALNAKCGRIFEELHHGELLVTFMERSK